MSCYLRHMRELFEVLGLEYDRPNRVRVDDALKRVLCLDDSSRCPEVWSAIKQLGPDERESLPRRVAEFLA